MKYDNVSCSQCGRSFGPGDHGFSHCDQHPGHVQSMTEWRTALLEAAETIRKQAEAMDPYRDDADLIAFELRPHIAGLRHTLAEMRRPQSRRPQRRRATVNL
jgi:hypothetical protein